MPNWIQPVATILAPIIAAILTGVVFKLRADAVERRRFTLALLEKYISPEFNIARHVVGDVQRKWANGDKTAVQKFLVPIIRSKTEHEEPVYRNSLTEHENLSWVLHFFASLELYRTGHLLEEPLFQRLFCSVYDGYRPFLVQFVLEYRSQMAEQPQRVRPAWVRGLEGLDKYFHPDK